MSYRQKNCPYEVYTICPYDMQTNFLYAIQTYIIMFIPNIYKTFCLFHMQKNCLYVIQTKQNCPYEVQTICLHVVQTKHLFLYQVQTNCLYLIQIFFCLYYLQTICLRMTWKNQSSTLHRFTLLHCLIFQWVALLVPLGTLIPPLPLFFHIFGFVVTQALIYICFVIAPMISNFPDGVFLIVLVKNNTVVEPHFGYGVTCR